jgi:hypothetical protein
MKLTDLLRRVALEADRAAVGKGRFFAIDGFAYGKRASVMAVKQPGMTGIRLVPYGFSCAKDTQHSVIKSFRTLNVVRADHHMVQHGLFSFLSMDCGTEQSRFGAQSAMPACLSASSKG